MRLGAWVAGGITVGRVPLVAADVVLTWADRSTNELGFRIERGSGLLQWSEIGLVGSNVATFVDRDVRPAITYSYRVQAYNDSGSSSYSNIATAFFAVPPRLNLPPIVGAVSDQSILAGASTDAIGFTIADPDTPLSELTVSVRSSNPTLVPPSSITTAGAGALHLIKVTPPPEQSGTTTITIEIFDGETVVGASFQLEVVLATTPPVFTTIPVGASVDASRGFVLHAAATGEGAVLYQWFHDGQVVVGATRAEFAVPSAQRFHAGAYAVRALAGGRAVTSEPVWVAVSPLPTSGSRLINCSTRAWCGVDEAVVIAGLVVEGRATKHLIVRAVGPMLATAPFALTAVLPDPRLALKRWNGVSYDELGGNTDWSLASDLSGLQAAMAAVSAFPLAERTRDAALFAALEPGQYTVVVDDEQQRSGLALVEVYDADPTTGAAAVTNFSNRGWVGTGGAVMIMGFVVAEQGPLSVLLRAVGPQLAAAPFLLSGALRDPVMEVYGPDGSGGQILHFTNDNWSESPDCEYTAQVAATVHAFALEEGGGDAAVVATFAPGAYTVVVRGQDGGSGVAIMELYTAP